MTIKEFYADRLEKYVREDENRIIIHEVTDEVKNFGYGQDIFYLTREQVQAILDGKCLELPENGGEYYMYLRIKSEGKRMKQSKVSNLVIPIVENAIKKVEELVLPLDTILKTKFFVKKLSKANPELLAKASALVNLIQTWRRG